MGDAEVATAQPAPSLGLVTTFPCSSFGRIEDQSRDRVLVRVGADIESEAAHFERVAMLRCWVWCSVREVVGGLMDVGEGMGMVSIEEKQEPLV